MHWLTVWQKLFLLGSYFIKHWLRSIFGVFRISPYSLIPCTCQYLTRSPDLLSLVFIPINRTGPGEWYCPADRPRCWQSFSLSVCPAQSFMLLRSQRNTLHIYNGPPLCCCVLVCTLIFWTVTCNLWAINWCVVHYRPVTLWFLNIL